MKFNFEKIGGNNIIKNLEIKGNISSKNIDDLISLIEQDIGFNEPIYFDFSNIHYIDSTAVGGLITVVKKLKENNCYLGIIAIKQSVKMIMTNTKILEFFKFYESVEDIK